MFGVFVMKTTSMDNETSSLIERMSVNDTEAILLGAQSDIPILNLNAAIFGAKFKCTAPEFIEALKTKMLYSDSTFMGTPLASFAVAALDVLRIQKYRRTDKFICELISSNFDFK